MKHGENDNTSGATATENGPLHGLVVVDLTRVLAGPYATMLLADLGARVIKVEPPGGDDARRFGPFRDGDGGGGGGGKSAYFDSLNRGKQSIVLDLRTAPGRVTFEKLVARADVLVENNRAGALKKLGYGWASLRSLSRRIIYAAISGFGQTGPYRELPAYDLVVQGMGGLMSITGEARGKPVRVGTSLGDITAGLFALSGILSALHRRERTGVGCMVDIGMLDCQVAILENAIARHLAAHEPPAPLGMRHPSITPFDGYRVSDEYLIIAAGNDQLFRRLCAALGNEALADLAEFASNERRTENHAALKAEIEKALAKRRAHEWLEILRQAGVPCAPINDIGQVVDDPHIAARNMIVDSLDEHGNRARMAGNPIKLSDCADPTTRPAAPQLDAHRSQILAWLEGSPQA